MPDDRAGGQRGNIRNKNRSDRLIQRRSPNPLSPQPDSKLSAEE